MPEITSLMGIQSHLIEEEIQKDCPYEKRIAQLGLYLDELARERAETRLHDHEKIARIRRENGAKIREWRAQHRIALS